MTYGKTTYVVRDLMDWVRSIKLTDVKIEHLMWEDCFLIGNMSNGQTYKVSRYQLEDSATPRIEIIKGIASVLNLTHQEVVEMIRVSEREQIMADSWNKVFGKDYHTAILDDAVTNTGVTGITYIPPNPSNSWISVGSGGGGAIGMNYNPNGTIMHDMPELDAEQSEKDEYVRTLGLRTRLFTEAEREEITNAKHKIVLMFAKHRLAEEKAIPFKLDKIVIAGGCFASVLNNEPIKDIDVFLLDDDYNRVLANGMAESYRSDEPVTVFPQPPRGVLTGAIGQAGANVVTGSISLAPKKNKRVRIGNSNYMDNTQIEQTVFFEDSRMQYITTKYKTREELVNHFDFKHCCVSYDFTKDKLYITREVYDLIKSKKLVQNSDRIPAQWRFEKFQGRGWKHEPLDVMFL